MFKSYTGVRIKKTKVIYSTFNIQHGSSNLARFFRAARYLIDEPQAGTSLNCWLFLAAEDTVSPSFYRYINIVRSGQQDSNSSLNVACQCGGQREEKRSLVCVASPGLPPPSGGVTLMLHRQSQSLSIRWFPPRRSFGDGVRQSPIPSWTSSSCGQNDCPSVFWLPTCRKRLVVILYQPTRSLITAPVVAGPEWSNRLHST